MFLSRWISCLSVLLITLATTTAAENARGARILAIGDSLMVWNSSTRKSIADVVARGLGEPVVNRAVSGAQLSYALPISGALGLNIGRQYRGGSWDWIILTGGGNDLLLGCGCNKCTRKINQLISKDGRKGILPSLVLKLRKSGAKVIHIGYLRSPGVNSMIESCRDEGNEFEARLTRLAKKYDGYYFISNANLVPYRDTSFHAADIIHPSIKGSRAIGNRVIKLIQKHDKTR